MMDFKTYWEEKAQKRRKSWVAKSKQFAEQHTKLEVIRKKVFLPFAVSSNRQRMIITNYLQDPGMSEIKSSVHLQSFQMYFTSPATPTNSCTF